MEHLLKPFVIIRKIPIAEMYVMNDDDLRQLSEQRGPNGYPTHNAHLALKVFRERYAPDMWTRESCARRVKPNYAAICFQETGVPESD